MTPLTLSGPHGSEDGVEALHSEQTGSGEASDEAGGGEGISRRSGVGRHGSVEKNRQVTSLTLLNFAVLDHVADFQGERQSRGVFSIDRQIAEKNAR